MFRVQNDVLKVEGTADHEGRPRNDNINQSLIVKFSQCRSSSCIYGLGEGEKWV